jgi:uncharacterized membrane protein
MKNGRPKLKIAFDAFDIIIECISIALLLMMWLYVITEYSTLSDTVASHFNAQGKADGFSNKSIVLLIPCIATFTYALMLVLSKYPHLHNYMVNITPENAYKNYKFSIRLLRIVNFLCVVLMVYITYYIIEGAKGREMSLGSLFIPLVIGLSILLTTVILLYQRKLNKE